MKLPLRVIPEVTRGPGQLATIRDADGHRIATNMPLTEARRLAVMANSFDDLRKSLGALIDVVTPNIYPQPDKPDSAWAKLTHARAVYYATEIPNETL